MSHCFYGEADKPAIISPPNSSIGSAQKRDVLTSASGLPRHRVLAEVRKWSCIVHGQSALCFLFVGTVAEPKVNS